MAVKELHDLSDAALKDFDKEASLLFKCSHPCIVKMFGASDAFDEDR